MQCRPILQRLKQFFKSNCLNLSTPTIYKHTIYLFMIIELNRRSCFANGVMQLNFLIETGAFQRGVTRVTDKEFQTRNGTRKPKKVKKTKNKNKQIKSKIEKTALKYGK